MAKSALAIVTLSEAAIRHASCRLRRIIIRDKINNEVFQLLHKFIKTADAIIIFYSKLRIASSIYIKFHNNLLSIIKKIDKYNKSHKIILLYYYFFLLNINRRELKMDGRFFSFISLLVLSQLTCVTQAEYLVCTHNRDNQLEAASEQQFLTALPILEKYQFPSSLQFRAQLLQELTPEQMNELTTHEHEFITRKLHELDPSLVLLFIPTTLWELIALRQIATDVAQERLSAKDHGLGSTNHWSYNFRKNVNECHRAGKAYINAFFQQSGIKPPIAPKYVGPYREFWEENPERTEENYPGITAYENFWNQHKQQIAQHAIDLLRKNISEKPNNLLVIQVLDKPSCKSEIYGEDIIINWMYKYIMWLVNNSIINFIQHHSDLSEINENILMQQIIQDFGHLAHEKNIGEFTPLTKICQTARFDLSMSMKKCLPIEHEAYQKGWFTLYRGTNGFECRLDKIIKNKGDDGLSYGNSIFAGLFNDSTGGRSACVFTYLKSVSSLSYGLQLPKEDFFKSTSFIKQVFNISPLRTIMGLVGNGETFHSRARQLCGVPDEEQEAAFQKLLSTQARIIGNVSSVSDEQLLSDFVATQK